jgi:hypothetical protein
MLTQEGLSGLHRFGCARLAGDRISIVTLVISTRFCIFGSHTRARLWLAVVQFNSLIGAHAHEIAQTSA